MSAAPTTPQVAPEFEYRLEGRAISKFSPKENIASLVDYLRSEGWRGKLTIHLPGNKGISAIEFEEVRRMEREK
jgi:hypothetical protein